MLEIPLEVISGPHKGIIIVRNPADYYAPKGFVSCKIVQGSTRKRVYTAYGRETQIYNEECVLSVRQKDIEKRSDALRKIVPSLIKEMKIYDRQNMSPKELLKGVPEW